MAVCPHFVHLPIPSNIRIYSLQTQTLKNVTSARVSVPSIIERASESDGPGPDWRWRTSLRSTAPYWTSKVVSSLLGLHSHHRCSDWFKGLSQGFLNVRTARILVLAGTDRLDRDLMIGQMQGKFQCEVIAGVGHHLQEDNPTRLAELLVEFWRRNERPIVNGVKKVGET